MALGACHHPDGGSIADVALWMMPNRTPLQKSCLVRFSLYWPSASLSSPAWLQAHMSHAMARLQPFSFVGWPTVLGKITDSPFIRSMHIHPVEVYGGDDRQVGRLSSALSIRWSALRQSDLVYQAARLSYARVHAQRHVGSIPASKASRLARIALPPPSWRLQGKTCTVPVLQANFSGDLYHLNLCYHGV